MSEREQGGPAAVVVHGLLVCRNAEIPGPGRLNLQDVLEVVALDRFPGDAGPLTFVALVRGLSAGPGRFAFTLHPRGRHEHVTAHLPGTAEVPPGSADRQLALQVRVPSIPVQRGGWYDVVFSWEGRPLASNRFAIGVHA
jgi:hypothetical protein